MANLLQAAVGTLLGGSKPGGGNNKGAVMRYPAQQPSGAPAVMFTRQKPQYSEAATRGDAIRSRSDVQSGSGTAGTSSPPVIYEEVGKVAMYMPMGISIADNMVYDTAATGILGNMYSRGREINMEDVQSAITNPSNALETIGNQFSDINADLGATGARYGGVAAAAVLAKLGLGAGLVGGVVNTALQEEQKNIQASVNPREFLLFKSPGLRSFSMNFRFIPESESEAQTVDAIVKWFRTGMYPEITQLGWGYKFPDAFQIQFVNVDGIPNLPETFLESASVTFNQNSMSYYKSANGGRPVEVNLALTFKELQPLNRQLVEGGF
jgi:hypothetical protein